MNTSAFLITSLIMILIPGTGVIYTVSLGISEGGKKAFLRHSDALRAFFLIYVSASFYRRCSCRWMIEYSWL